MRCWYACGSPEHALSRRDFLAGAELGAFELGKLLDRAAELKAGRREGVGSDSLRVRSVALVFERPSTRTRTNRS